MIDQTNLTGIFDSHAHYDDPEFSKDQEEILNQLFNFGISKICNVGADIQSSIDSVELAKKYEKIVCSVGIHPLSISSTPKDYLKILEKLTENEKVVAIGEIGLDFHEKNFNYDEQVKFFVEQLNLAEKLNKPVIIHCRDALKDLIEILKTKQNVKGIVHCFSGNLEEAKTLINLGWFLGFTGVITFKNVKKQIEVLKNISLEKILIETDCPYMAPEPWRGKRNNSSMLVSVVKKIAEVKQISEDEVVEKTNLNAKKAFHLI